LQSDPAAIRRFIFVRNDIAHWEERSKWTEPTLDRTDLRLLALLQRDGRATNAELADAVNLSPSACLRRIQRLEAERRDRRLCGAVDPQGRGPGPAGLCARAAGKARPRRHRPLHRRVQGWDEVVACYALTGDMDYLLQVVVQDLEHFSRFLLDRLLNAAAWPT
jgi:Lrp/AsnC family leucine-responsive transcriptional regulator